MANVNFEKSAAYLILGGITVISLAGAIFFYFQFQKAQTALKNPTLVAQQEANQIIAKVGMLIQLPTGEQPTIATISDITKLQDQQFFANGKNGDKVLIYTRAKEAILYDPFINKIVNVAPVNIGQSPTAAPTTAEQPTPTTPIRQGKATPTP